MFTDPQLLGELGASLGFRRLYQDKKKEGKEKENGVKGSEEQWMCLLVAARQWGGAEGGKRPPALIREQPPRAPAH